MSDTIEIMKEQTTEQDNTIASHISVVGFVYATHNEIPKFNEETNDPILKNGLKYKYPTKEEICMVNVQMTRIQYHLVLQKCKLKAQEIPLCIGTKMAKIKKADYTECQNACGGPRISHILLMGM